ncbi:MAG: hypothetical protein KDJ77_11330 [Rhodobiaceae bacterium]|nr:hypothetical protein [Rhodobiaceae bacterium]
MLAALALLAGGCAPTGDYGRPEPSFIHDTVYPLVGAANALNRGETVTFLPLTDNEKGLRARAYTIIVARDILGDAQSVKPYLRYRNIVRPWPHTTPVNAYHDRILFKHYESADTRFSKILSDMRKDSESIAPFRAAADAVVVDDQIRRKVIATEPELAARTLKGADARMTDNDRIIGLTTETLSHRLKIYSYALRHLAVETPTRRMLDLEAAYRELEKDVLTLEHDYDGKVAFAMRMRGDGPLDLAPAGAGGYSEPVQANSLARPR